MRVLHCAGLGVRNAGFAKSCEFFNVFYINVLASLS